MKESIIRRTNGSISLSECNHTRIGKTIEWYKFVQVDFEHGGVE